MTDTCWVPLVRIGQHTKFKSVVMYPPACLYTYLSRLTDAVVMGSCYIPIEPRLGQSFGIETV